MSVELDRAMILLEQSRPDLAESQLREELCANPENPTAHALLSLCLAEAGRFDEAVGEARTAVRLAPDLAFAHYSLASVLQDADQPDQALTSVQEALMLDPEQANFHALHATIRFDQGDWTEALRAAEEALRFDPEHIMSLNLRAMALVRLGREKEADGTIATALSKDPENAVTHATRGWVLLREGRYEQGRYRLYHAVLQFFIWMSGLSMKAQWSLIVGGFTGYWVLQLISFFTPALSPWVWTVLTIYLLFGILAWIAYPLFNLLLLLNPMGRLALTREQARAAKWVGAHMLGGLVLAALGAVTQNMDVLFAAGVVSLQVLPLAGMYRCRRGRPPRNIGWYTAAVGAIGAIGICLLLVGAVLPGEPAQHLTRFLGLFVFLQLFLVGVFFSGLVTIGLMMLKPRRV
jgi:Tfp pilus assembly protein PilF